jgi:surfeit locus 1 family protein
MGRTTVRRKAFLAIIPLTAGILGTWQVFRYRSKLDLLEKIKENLQQPAIALPTNLETLATNIQPNGLRYEALGKPDSHQAIYIGPKYKQYQKGYYLISPYTLTGGQRILVHYGWLAEKDLGNLDGTDLNRYQKITGVFRMGERGWFQNKHSSSNGPWYWVDIKSIAKALNTLPILIESTDAHQYISSLLKTRSEEERIQIPNNHLQYIITWYSISLITGWMWLLK